MNNSDEIRLVLKSSREIAIEAGDDHISSYHFLLAILRNENLVKKLFDKRDWKFEHLTKAINKEEKILVPDYFISIELERMLIRSNYYRWVYFKRRTSIEHFIFSMLADKNSLAGQYLIEVGLDYDCFKSELLELDNFKTKTYFEKLGRNQFALNCGLIRVIGYLV